MSTFNCLNSFILIIQTQQLDFQRVLIVYVLRYDHHFESKQFNNDSTIYFLVIYKIFIHCWIFFYQFFIPNLFVLPKYACISICELIFIYCRNYFHKSIFCFNCMEKRSAAQLEMSEIETTYKSRWIN